MARRSFARPPAYPAPARAPFAYAVPAPFGEVDEHGGSGTESTHGSPGSSGHGHGHAAHGHGHAAHGHGHTGHGHTGHGHGHVGAAFGYARPQQQQWSGGAQFAPMGVLI